MDDRKLILSIFGFFYIAAMCGAVENPNAGNPFRIQSAPAHSGQSQRFITQGNQYGRTGNDIVTGNVGGGKHFRGVVPYGSSYYSGAYSNTQGSGAVSDFIRRSQNPIINDRNPGQAPTYIDPRRSVTSMRRADGTSGLSNPHLEGQGRRTNPYSIPLSDQTPLLQNQRPLSNNNMTLDQILAQRGQLREELEKKTHDSTEEESTEKGFFDDVMTPELLETESMDEKEQQTQPEPVENLLSSVLEDRDRENERAHNVGTEQSTESEQKDDFLRFDRISPKSDLVPELDIEKLSADGRRVLGEHETFESLADEKFKTFMDAAEAFVKDGQFYKAADTYALAIVWKPKDARAYLGQSFSLFGAGEYMSSAYYLKRAFELNPEAAAKKYNLAELINNRDVFDNRILEIGSWQQRSGSGELAFLLAYISYQDGRAERAVEQIRKAQEAMPDEPAIPILKNIIDPGDVLN